MRVSLNFTAKIVGFGNSAEPYILVESDGLNNIKNLWGVSLADQNREDLLKIDLHKLKISQNKIETLKNTQYIAIKVELSFQCPQTGQEDFSVVSIEPTTPPEQSVKTTFNITNAVNKAHLRQSLIGKIQRPRLK